MPRHLSLRQATSRRRATRSSSRSPCWSPIAASMPRPARACGWARSGPQAHVPRARPRQRAGQRGDARATSPSARRRSREAGKLGLKVLERADCEKLGMGAYLGVAQGSQEPPKFIHLTYTPQAAARASASPSSARASPSTRAGSISSRRRHAADEGRHVGRRRGARRLPRPASSQAADRGARPDCRDREHAVGHRAAARRHRARHERAHDRDRQYRRRGTPHPRRRAVLRRQGDQAGRDDRPGHADRRGRDRARPGHHGPVREPRRPRSSAAGRRRGGRGDDVAPAAIRRIQGRAQERHRRPQQRLEPARGGGDRRRALHARLHGRGARGRISTSRAPPSASASSPLGPKGAHGRRRPHGAQPPADRSRRS